jgi:hypothetical protein
MVQQGFVAQINATYPGRLYRIAAGGLHTLTASFFNSLAGEARRVTSACLSKARPLCPARFDT